MDEVQIKEMVRARYGSIAAATEAACCAPVASSCCGPETAGASHDKSRRMGYSEAELASVPDGAEQPAGDCSRARRSSISAAVPVLTVSWPPSRSAKPRPDGAATWRRITDTVAQLANTTPSGPVH